MRRLLSGTKAIDGFEWDYTSTLRSYSEAMKQSVLSTVTQKNCYCAIVSLKGATIL